MNTSKCFLIYYAMQAIDALISVYKLLNSTNTKQWFLICSIFRALTGFVKMFKQPTNAL